MASPTARAADVGRVAVLMGGASAEREISLKTGGAVLRALQARGVLAEAIDTDRSGLSRIEAFDFDRVFIALHGRGGEDGTIQGFLDSLGIPYTGSGVLGSALAMDKLRSKALWAGVGLPTPRYLELKDEVGLEAVADTLGLPVIIKPSEEGSSVGMTKVNAPDALLSAWQQARRLDSPVFAEQWVRGKEYTATILGEEVLPLIRIETPRDFYDYDAKYQAADTRYHCPCGLPPDQEHRLAELARRAFEALGCRGWGRVDFICDEQSAPWLIEVNTVPGMTDHSLVPMAAKAAGLSFEDLVWRILGTSMGQEQRSRHGQMD